MKSLTTTLLLGVTLLQAQQLQFFKMATIHSNHITKIKTSTENELVCIGGTTGGLPTTYMFSKDHKTIESPSKEMIKNVSFGLGKRAVFSTLSGDYYTADFRAFLKGKGQVRILSGLRSPSDTSTAATNYLIFQNYIFSHTALSSKLTKDSSFITRKALHSNESIKRSFPIARMGCVKTMLLNNTTEQIYVYFDSVTIVLDTHLDVIEERKGSDPVSYKILRVYNNDTIIGVSGSTLRLLDFNLNLKKEFTMPDSCTDLCVDNHKNIFVIRSNAVSCDLYKVELSKFAASGQENSQRALVYESSPKKKNVKSSVLEINNMFSPCTPPKRMHDPSSFVFFSILRWLARMNKYSVPHFNMGIPRR
ncbi:MAG TPA: hypothetical protein VL947_04565 [Cytophagales bacterium]|nr:hypothetical protein [Cytophagales bacterium]